MTSFIKVACPECKNEQTIFAKPASTVRCVICDHVLAQSTGSVAKVTGKIVLVVE